MNAGYIVGQLMQHLGYVHDVQGKMPDGCVAKTAMKWKRRKSLQTVHKMIIIRTVDMQGELIAMAKSRLRLVKPATENRTVAAPVRRPNAELRTREYLTEAEVARLIEAAKDNRYGHRDATMILMAYRHGLRVSELVDLRWDQIDFDAANLSVRRAKKGSPSTHPILGDELRALRRLNREQEPKSPFVFTSERGSPCTTAGFARMVERAGEAAKLSFKAHPHMLRHACGFRARQQGARYPRLTGLSRAQEHPAYGALHRIVARSLQGLLAIDPASPEIFSTDRWDAAARGFRTE
jgi:integrase